MPEDSPVPASSSSFKQHPPAHHHNDRQYRPRRLAKPKAPARRRASTYRSSWLPASLSSGDREIPAPIRRRQRLLLRRILLAILSGLFVWSSLQYLAVFQAQASVITAKHSISAGSTIDSSDLVLSFQRTNSLTGTTVRSESEAVGKIARISFNKGDPILPAGLSSAPTYPKDYTTLTISPASTSAILRAGQKVDLISSSPCRHNNRHNNEPSENSEYRDQGCLIAHNAVILSVNSSSRPGLSLTGSEEKPATITVALPVASALIIVQADDPPPLIVTNIRD